MDWWEKKRIRKKIKMTKKERESQREREIKREREKKNCLFRKILSTEKMSCQEKEVMISDKFILFLFLFFFRCYEALL